jgi:hypothetical protein
LDWLAVDFRENGWDIKRLVKQMVMSTTYRQSSIISSRNLEIDPENDYLARMPRTRLEAETIRDHVLASSGLLNREIGGPSVKPYQPEGLWDAATSGRGILKKYIQDKGDKLYRRGLYTFIKRTVPPPSMLMFDASNRDQCEVQRLNTSTPLQALVMLNDPTVLEASRVLAERLLEKDSDITEKIKEAGRRILCRTVKEDEIDLLLRYHEEEIVSLSQNPEKAAKMIQIGEYPFSNNRNEIEVAALMQVIHTMYNMEEAITKS